MVHNTLHIHKVLMYLSSYSITSILEYNVPLYPQGSFIFLYNVSPYHHGNCILLYNVSLHHHGNFNIFYNRSFENIKIITCFRIKSVKQTFCFYRITKYIIHLLLCYNSIFIFIIYIKVTLVYYNNNFKMLPCLKIKNKINSSFNTNCSFNKNMFHSQ